MADPEPAASTSEGEVEARREAPYATGAYGVDEAWEEDAGDAAGEGPGDAWSGTYENPRVQGSKTRVVLQGVLLGVGVGVFVALVFVWLESAESDLTAWLVMLVVLLAVVLVAEILLLEPVYRRLFHRVPAGLPAPEGEDSYVVGCPGCGTVFTVTEEEIELGAFSCQNCGRQGVVKDQNLSRADVQRETCRSCGNTYYEYLEHSECPVCHTFNEY